MLTSQITVHNNFILKVNTILGVGSEGVGGGLLQHYGKSLAIFLCWGGVGGRGGRMAPYQC